MAPEMALGFVDLCSIVFTLLFQTLYVVLAHIPPIEDQTNRYKVFSRDFSRGFPLGFVSSSDHEQATVQLTDKEPLSVN